jgi:hypothetical protein
MNELPLGIWYEESRSRFRVRMYRNREVIHLSYHKTRKDAETTLRGIKNETIHKGSPLERLILQTQIFYKQRRPRH